MVGVPRSKGCSVCVKRRVKCDEERPQCGNCLKYGVECPGYRKELKFVVGKTRRTRKQSLERNRRPATNSQSGASSGREKRERALKTQLYHHSTRPEDFRSPETFETQALAQVIMYLSQESTTGFVPTVAWLAQVAGRPNPSGLLRTAIQSLTAHQLGLKNGDLAMVSYSRSAYGHAITRLRLALGHSVEWSSSDTLCSVVILAFFELFNGTSGDSWMKHAAGVCRLMQLRGPQSHHDAFDRSILIAFQGVIIMHCFFSGLPCFLAEPEWQAVLRERSDGTLSPDLFDLFLDFHYCLALSPPIAASGYNLREAHASKTPVDPRSVEELINKTLEYYHKLDEWHDRFCAVVPPAKEVPASQGDVLYSTVYQYDDVMTGTMLCGYYAMMIVCQLVLMTARHNDFARSVDEFADKICKSAQFLGAGTMGPYRMGFSIRIAYEVGGVERRQWIQSLLSDFSKTYASSNPKYYPDVDQSYKYT